MPLHFALENNLIAIVKILILKGADFNIAYIDFHILIKLLFVN